MLNTVAMTILAINAIHVNRDFQKGPSQRGGEREDWPLVGLVFCRSDKNDPRNHTKVDDHGFLLRVFRGSFSALIMMASHMQSTDSLDKVFADIR
jgi:hypothetical protein